MVSLIYIIWGIVIVSLLLLLIQLWKALYMSADDKTANEAEQQLMGRRDLRLLRRTRRKVDSNCMDDVEDEDDLVDVQDKGAYPNNQLIGRKKLKKLQQKAERRQYRMEIEEQRERMKEIQEQKKLQVEAEERKKDNEKRKKLEEDQRLREDEKRKSDVLYREIKQGFEVSQEGFEFDDSKKISVAEFIEYLKTSRVCPIEEIASHFSMKFGDVMNRINDLLNSGDLIGILDDRCRFIWVDEDILDRLARKAKSLGRFSISEFAAHCNDIVLK
ncbi:hypothetical protein ACOME3_004516 [Neoechinorhynchus agilis]